MFVFISTPVFDFFLPCTSTRAHSVYPQTVVTVLIMILFPSFQHTSHIMTRSLTSLACAVSGTYHRNQKEYHDCLLTMGRTRNFGVLQYQQLCCVSARGLFTMLSIPSSSCGIPVEGCLLLPSMVGQHFCVCISYSPTLRIENREGNNTQPYLVLAITPQYCGVPRSTFMNIGLKSWKYCTKCVE